MRTSAANLADQLEGTKKKLESAEKDAKEAPTLREANEKLQTSNERQQKELDELKPFLEKDDGKKIRATLAELERTRFAAISGWAVSALLCAGLVALYFYFKPLADDGALDHDAPQAEDRQTHRID